MKKALLVVAVAALLSSCAGVRGNFFPSEAKRKQAEQEELDRQKQAELSRVEVVILSNQTFPETREDALEILTETPSRPFVAIAMLALTGRPKAHEDTDYLTFLLRSRASRLGANAIYKFTFEDEVYKTRTDEDTFVLPPTPGKYPPLIGSTSGHTRAYTRKRLQGVAIRFTDSAVSPASHP